ncbi:MAG: 4Fe-4S binding protein [Planctomycetaceae bacterium]|nr:4Fe-4S binding protein [Planctomycetaceae bacterium]
MIFLKRLRVLVAIVLFSLFAYYVVSPEENTLKDFGAFLVRIQFTQSFLSHELFGIPLHVGIRSLLTILFWGGIAWFLGRIYCSAICPFGILQDVFSRMTQLVRGKKRKFQYRKPMTKTRLVLFALFCIGLLTVPAFVTILDPYSNITRILTWLMRPVYLTFGQKLGLFNVPPYIGNIYFSGILLAVPALLIAGTLAVLYGRRYCNTICPVGTFFGLCSRYSWFKVRLNSKCVSCKLCESACKGECIDAKNETIDSSRCVACFNCLSTCKRGAISYSPSFGGRKEPSKSKSEKVSRKTQNVAERLELPIFSQPTAQLVLVDNINIVNDAVQSPRRRFLMRLGFYTFGFFSFMGLLSKKQKADSVVASESTKSSLDSATAVLALPQGESRIGYDDRKPILPPGARSLKHYKRHCTGCHLCVTKCPSGVIRPSTSELGMSGFMQPIIVFDTFNAMDGFYCEYECTICSRICPTGALQPLTKEEKILNAIGKAKFLRENCVVNTQKANCAACDEHCPTKAIKMVAYDEKNYPDLVIPEIETAKCIGCGACEHVCPVRPYRAIYVDGLEQHEKAAPAFDPNAKQEEVKIEGFDFL